MWQPWLQLAFDFCPRLLFTIFGDNFIFVIVCSLGGYFSFRNQALSFYAFIFILQHTAVMWFFLLLLLFLVILFDLQHCIWLSDICVVCLFFQSIYITFIYFASFCFTCSKRGETMQWNICITYCLKSNWVLLLSLLTSNLYVYGHFFPPEPTAGCLCTVRHWCHPYIPVLSLITSGWIWRVCSDVCVLNLLFGFFLKKCFVFFKFS